MRKIFDEIYGVRTADENARVVLDRVEKVLDKHGKTDASFKRMTVKLIYCESRNDPMAKNKQAVIYKGRNYGHASGLFQFLPSTFKSVGGGDIWNIEDQTEAYVKMVNANRLREWACY